MNKLLTGTLLLIAPLFASAQAGDMTFITDTAKITITSACIEYVAYQQEKDRHFVAVNIDQPCAGELSAFTRKHMGKMVQLEYKDQRVYQAKILTALGRGFQIDPEQSSLPVLRQLIADYGNH